MSSPNLNYIIALGAIVLYVNVIVLVTPTTDDKEALFLCNVSIYIHFLCGTLKMSSLVDLTSPYTISSFHYTVVVIQHRLYVQHTVIL